MKKFVSVLMVVFMCFSLVGCGSSGPVKNGLFTISVDKFSEKVNTVVSKNGDLEGLTIGDLSEGENDASSMLAYDGGQPIGIYMLKADDKGNLQSVIVVIESSGPKSGQYLKMMIAAWMALDDGLSYEEAKEISKTIEMEAIVGGEGVEKNGVKYECLSSDEYAFWGARPADSESK